jgi:hypothetical protein
MQLLTSCYYMIGLEHWPKLKLHLPSCEAMKVVTQDSDMMQGEWQFVKLTGTSLQVRGYSVVP